jgi:hypothetical protein
MYQAKGEETMSYNRKEVTWDVGTDGKVAVSDDTWRYVYKALDLHQNVGYIGGGHDADCGQFLMLVSPTTTRAREPLGLSLPKHLQSFSHNRELHPPTFRLTTSRRSQHVISEIRRPRYLLC